MAMRAKSPTSQLRPAGARPAILSVRRGSGSVTVRCWAMSRPAAGSVMLVGVER